MILHSQEIQNKIKAGILIGVKLWSKGKLLEKLAKDCCKAARKKT